MSGAWNGGNRGGAGSTKRVARADLPDGVAGSAAVLLAQCPVFLFAQDPDGHDHAHRVRDIADHVALAVDGDGRNDEVVLVQDPRARPQPDGLAVERGIGKLDRKSVV